MNDKNIKVWTGTGSAATLWLLSIAVLLSSWANADIPLWIVNLSWVIFLSVFVFFLIVLLAIVLIVLLEW